MVWLPRNCPDCQAILSPATQPKPGDRCQCNLCGIWLVFDHDLVLQLPPPKVPDAEP